MNATMPHDEERRCGRCGRPLSNLRALRRGYGRTCYKKLVTNIPLPLEDTDSPGEGATE